MVTVLQFILNEYIFSFMVHRSLRSLRTVYLRILVQHSIVSNSLLPTLSLSLLLSILPLPLLSCCN
jgi:hypothetical protein